MESRVSDEFLALADLGISQEDDSPLSAVSGRPDLETLFAEFARSRPRRTHSPTSDPRRSMDSTQNVVPRFANVKPKTDLRALEYVSEYDSHLMCPICHVPFIDPVVLECDHTFCSSCYEDYRTTSANTERVQCPTCRSYTLASLRKASRLITNMCNDIRVRCPNEGCRKIFLRSCIDQHCQRDCEEERLQCPDPNCPKLTKRKDVVPGECRHSSHIECECGQLVALGKGDWLKHKDEDCPANSVKCKNCDEQIPSRTYLAGWDAHVCDGVDERCPGYAFGCEESLGNDGRDGHVSQCPIARLAPYLRKQAQLLVSTQEQLVVAKVRNEVLETGFDRLNDLIHDQILPKIDNSDIEEIERTPSPATAARDLLLPAHLRALTPSPSPEQASQQHLLALHESLRGNVTNLETDISHLANSIADLDARTSMQIMNETLRIKEDLAHTNAALFSTRAQVQWLLNRERQGQQMNTRGRTAATTITASATPALAEAAATSSASMAGPSSAAVSAANTPALRPVRRPSGGSQERVKL